MIITVKCPQCGQQFSREFDTTKVNRVMTGELVQDVFPELSADERELYFISHICPVCWDKLFGVEPTDEEIENLIELSAEEFADTK